MYDTTQAASFDECKAWLEKARKHIDEEVPILLVGTQSDKVNEQRVSFKTAEKFKCKQFRQLPML
jgi:GTPase SAR1 family protein